MRNNRLENEAYQSEISVSDERKLLFHKLKNQKILITGATGLIGYHLIHYLLEQDEKYDLKLSITALIRNEEKAQKRFENVIEQKKDTLFFLIGDICDTTVLHGEWDYIIHGAGNAHPRAFSTEPVETMKANLIGTINLLEYMKQQQESSPVSKFVLLSSGEVYGETPMPEDGWKENMYGCVDSMQTRSCYPESKRAAETLCCSYYKEYQLQTVVARLSYIYGGEVQEDNSRADAQFYRNAKNRQDIVMKSEGSQLRSYCYVKDAVSALLLLMLKGKPGEAYNIANTESVVTIKEYAKTLSDAYGVNLVQEIPDQVEKAGYSTMKKEVLNPQKLYELGWKPEYTLQSGIQDMVDNTIIL